MPTRRASLILPLLALPALAGCGGEPDGPAPVSEAALAAVVTKPGVGRERLARAVDAMFTAEGIGHTRAVIVLRGGEVIAERYAEGFGAKTRFVGWSLSKTVTAVLIGLLVADGRLRLDESVPIPAWQRSGDPRGEITLRQLLQMRSGLRHREKGDPPWASDEVRMLFLEGRDDMAGFAEAQPLEAEPGRTFEYSTATTTILADLAARALTDSRDPAARRKAVSDYLHARLLEPARLTSMVPEFDRAGTMIGASFVHATARDWARFGELLRNYGSVRGAQIVPRGWIEFMTRPSPRNPGYGAQVWLNRPQSTGRKVLFPERGPASLFACVGHLGQYVLVSPRQKLTVVRLGHTPDAQRGALVEKLSDVVALFPSR